jgi:hypothetical protein
MTPWTPRERALHKALEAIIGWMESDTPSTAIEADAERELYLVIHRQARAAIADPPPPDPRDESLRLAEEALNLAPGRVDLRLLIMAGGSEPSDAMSAHIEAFAVAKKAALAAIAAAKGEK